MAKSVGARGPACVHAAPPCSLAQAEKTLRRSLGLGAARRRARAVLEIGDMRDQRRLAEEPAERADATIQLQVGERVCNVCGMTESNNTAGHRMPNFIKARTDRSLDESDDLSVAIIL